MRGLVFIFMLMGPYAASASVSIYFHKNGFKESDIQQLGWRLEDLVRRGERKVVIDLNSVGGDLTGLLGRSSYKQGLAYKVEALKNAGLHITTRVRRGNVCESSCTALFAIGDIRQASVKSQFMFHAIHLRKAGAEKKRLRNLYADRWLDLIASVDPGLALYLDKKNWLTTRKKDWVVSGRSLKNQFGQYINVLTR